MSQAEQDNLKENGEMLLNLMMSDKEAEPIKKDVQKYMDEIKKQACKFYYNRFQNLQNQICNRKMNLCNQLINSTLNWLNSSLLKSKMKS